MDLDRIASSLYVTYPESLWFKPDFAEEAEEIELQARILEMDVGELTRALESGYLSILPDEVWEIIKNTDSWETEDLGRVRELSAEYEKDVGSILNGIHNKSPLPAPMVIYKPDVGYYLIGGNTRLMVCRALGIRPVVWFAKA